MSDELPYDVARCQPVGYGCPVKYKCKRYINKWNPNGRQSVFDGSSEDLAETGKGCEMRIPTAK